MEPLQERLGHVFRAPELLETALTHSSYANEHHCENNERLEFVGDSVLGMVVATWLYQNVSLPEGRMTRLRAELVCEHSLWEAAQRLGLGEYLRLGRGEEQTGGRQRPSILADCVEAVIAALYLDGGLDCARRFIHENILSRLDADLSPEGDYKTELQELVQQTPGSAVSYALTGERGPDHDKRFTASVSLGGEVLGAGEGRTKKEAEQMAARAALRRLRGV
ncbi:MAG: ribonuclease III [Oscillospiraceae bacterium]|nr:ribonuclease III [Oscillospiraceae bacterium]